MVIPLASIPAAPLAPVRAPDLSSALRLAASNPDLSVVLFADDWPDVDCARAAIAARGLGGRIAVHHRTALAQLLALRARSMGPVSAPGPMSRYEEQTPSR